jgi:hypothetical protein
MKVTEYIVDILHPGSPASVWVSFKSDTPFLGISAGDFVSPAFTYIQNPEEPAFETPGSCLLVSRVEHIISSRDGKNISHKIMVFTEEVECP